MVGQNGTCHFKQSLHQTKVLKSDSFDSSSKGHDGPSLNDYQEKRPNYINSLANVLAAWRWDAVAYAGDVQKMFNQVVVHPDDQIYHRFLWRKNKNEPPTVYQWLRLNLT